MLLKRSILRLCLAVFTGVESQAASTQPPDEVKYQVYSDYFRAEMQEQDAHLPGHTSSVFVGPLLRKEDTLDGLEHFTASICQWLGWQPLLPLNTPAGYAASPAEGRQAVQMTTLGHFEGWLAGDLAKARLVLQADSLLKAGASPLVSRFRLAVQPTLVADIGQVLPQGGRPGRRWPRFHRRYPGSFGIFGLSDVVLSADKQHAAFVLERFQHSFSGSGSLIFMKLTPQGWVQDFEVGFWTW